jgi:preprotein translocase subunit SecG
MIFVILLQKSEGGGMSGSQAASMFGGALTGASAGNFFTKLTAWLATIFFVLCAILAFMVSEHGAGAPGRSRVREALVQGAPPPPAPRVTPIGEMADIVELQDIPVLPAEMHVMEEVVIDDTGIDVFPEAPEIPEN